VTALVSATEVVKSYPQGRTRLTVLDRVTLQVAAGELVLIMGPSGSGKTTLVSILAGLLKPTLGRVELCGEPISELSSAAAARARRKHLGFVFQAYNLFDALTALDNVAEPLAMKGMAIKEARRRASLALEQVGLGERLHHRPRDLSGGEKQRVAIARALAGEPRLVFGDEPTAALDSTTAASVVALLRAAVAPDRSVILVTHDHRLERYADRIVRLEDGRIIADEEPPPASSITPTTARMRRDQR
jgi:putative ABC transport system ATP-binding protein